MPTSLTSCGEKCSVLLVDDEPVMRKLNMRILSPGFAPIAVATAEEALAHIRAGMVFDAIFCDHRLDGMSGVELFMRLLESYPAQAERFVILSGLPPTACDATVLEALGTRWLQKPIRPADLVRAANAAAEGRRAA